ncbi:hypothetical protein [Streptomyces sp. NPDC053720]|uniref:hypothetical protein n=1 Tax=Streptomyces sp. NPDC053720 TaxID=3154855 RepID=UPI00343E3D40
MTSMTETFHQALQTALASRATVSIRSTLIEILERDPTLSANVTAPLRVLVALTGGF